ncbi:MAG TPA: hypothetical protein VIU61_28670 [Kofleriaceae bacterium]
MFRILVLVSLVAGCDDPKGKVTGAAKKADQALENLDKSEAAGHLAKAREAVAAGQEPHDACSWVARTTDTSNQDVVQLRRVCKFEVPMQKARAAADKARKAREEQPEAPSLTECSSDDWAAAKKILDAEFSDDATWSALKTSWTKVCPGT